MSLVSCLVLDNLRFLSLFCLLHLVFTSLSMHSAEASAPVNVGALSSQRLDVLMPRASFEEETTHPASILDILCRIEIAFVFSVCYLLISHFILDR